MRHVILTGTAAFVSTIETSAPRGSTASSIASEALYVKLPKLRFGIGVWGSFRFWHSHGKRGDRESNNEADVNIHDGWTWKVSFFCKSEACWGKSILCNKMNGFFGLILTIYSQTWANDHLRIATACLQRSPFRGPIFSFYNIRKATTTCQQRPQI